MQVVTPEQVQGKKVLLRMDLDVPIQEGKVTEDFRLKAGLPTLNLCLNNAEQVIIMGHLGHPHGEDKSLSVEPIYDWLVGQGLGLHLEGGKLKLLENLRFDEGEDKCDLDYAKELASLGDPSTTSTALSTSSLRTSIFVNEAFAAYHFAASTTVLPTLLPHVAGLRFAQEVEKLTKIRDNPEHPLVIIIGGAKVEDKLPAVEAMAKIADYVLVGGRIAGEIFQGEALRGKASPYNTNVLVADLNEEGTDITKETIEKWKPIISKAKIIVWNGPLGIVEEPKNFQTHELANLIIQSDADSVIGGGDTIGYLGKLGLLEKFICLPSNRGFVSTGGGAMIKFLETGTLPTIQALQS